MEITIGNGKVYVANITQEGKRGILLRTVEKAREIGTDEIDFMPEGEEYIPSQKDIIIILENIEGARVLQDVINGACLMLNGYKIE